MKVIKAKEIVNDVRSGLSDYQLMEKYGLSHKGLQGVFKKLVDAKAMKPSELYTRAPIVADDTAHVENIRLELREFLEIRLPVRDLGDPTNTGVLSDISEDGVGIRGI
jgi:hypothetical protein